MAGKKGKKDHRDGRKKSPTQQQIADALGISASSVDYYARAGLLSYKVVRGRRRFNKQRNAREYARICKMKRQGYDMEHIRKVLNKGKAHCSPK